MEVILLEKIRNLGSLGDKAKVKAGFARNFLIPKGKAVPATARNIAKFEARRAELEKVAQENLQAAQARADKMNDLVLTIAVQAGEEGKLFGSVGPRDVAEALDAKGHKVAKSEIIMPQGAIRMTGEYEVHVQLHSDVRVLVKVNIVPSA